MPQLLYPWGKDSRYPLTRKLGGPQSHCGHFLKEKNFLLQSGVIGKY